MSERDKRKATYGALALAHAKKTCRGGKDQEPLPTIKPGQPEWDRWTKYFANHLGFEPYVMKKIRRANVGEFTVPAELPEQFDGSYSPERML